MRSLSRRPELLITIKYPTTYKERQTTMKSGDNAIKMYGEMDNYKFVLCLLSCLRTKVISSLFVY